MIYVISGGGAGGTLVVTGVAGSTVTAKKDGKAYNRICGDDGKATFRGLKSGTWLITMTDGTQTVSREVTITTDFELTTAYFSATISVSWPAGSACACTDGQQVLNAPDTSGSYTFNVPNTGEWTVTCTNGGDKTASKSVSITAEGQTETVTLAYAYVLYEAGTKYVDFTDKNVALGSSITWGSTNVTINVPSSISAIWATFTNSATVNLSNYSKLKCTLSALTIQSTASNYYFFVLGVSSTSDPAWNTDLIASKKLTSTNTSSAEQTVAVDISTISSGTIQMGVTGGHGYTSTATITKIWLE